jgi:hypothetical protein
MTYLNEIEALVRADGGAWQSRFRQHEAGGWMCVLMPTQRLTNSDYRILCARFSATAKPAISADQRLRNKLYAHVARSDRSSGGVK